MTIPNYDSSLVYESPDGGRTIYARRTGETNRVLVQRGPTTLAEKMSRWRDIIQLAETNPSLANALERAEIIYELVKKESNSEDS